MEKKDGHRYLSNKTKNTSTKYHNKNDEDDDDNEDNNKIISMAGH